MISPIFARKHGNVKIVIRTKFGIGQVGSEIWYVISPKYGRCHARRPTLIPARIKPSCVIMDVKINDSDTFSYLQTNKTVIWGAGVVTIRFQAVARGVQMICPVQILVILLE